MPSRFAPLRSLEAYPGNLPLQASVFIGREQDLTAVAQALEQSRLVTLTGVGGVGKTRLALQVGAEMLPRVADGAWVCELAVAQDAISMHQVVMATLGVVSHPGMTAAANIEEFIGTKQMLLVLDNCEHLLEASARLADGLLRRCPRLRVLATSREGLAVEGEQVWPLRSLPVPDDTSTIAAIATTDAVMLFAERARATRPDFAINERSAPAVVEICRRLDGIPLAIELAAARISSMSPQEIAGHLDERFRLLTGGRRTVAERHQTLRAAVDWSYSMLDPAARSLFDRLGAFAGPFDGEAAVAVGADDGTLAFEVLDALGTLVDKSMIVAEQTDEGTSRYQLLETMRQYALERLEAAGGADRIRRRHAAHYAELAEKVGPEVAGAGELVARRQILGDLDNLRAAVIWSLDDPDDTGTIAVRVIAVLGPATVNFDRVTGIGQWALQAVEPARHADPAARGVVLGTAAHHLFQSADFARARDLAREGAEALADVSSLFAWVPYVAWALGTWPLEGPEAALGVLEDGLARHPDEQNQAGMRTAAVHLELSRGRIEEARGACRRGPPRITSGREPLPHLDRTVPGRLLDVDERPRHGTYRARGERAAIARQGAAGFTLGPGLALVARLQARRGDAAAAAHALREAVVYTHTNSTNVLLLGVLNRGTDVLALLGRDLGAATLQGVVLDGCLGPFEALEVEPERVAIATVLDEVCTRLPADTYEAAIARGKAMTYDEVIEFTLAEIDALADA